MKTILALLILFSAIALPALGELTVEDIEKIDAKIKESETRMKEHMTQQVDSLKTPVAWLIGILVAVIALIGIPLVVLTIMIGWRKRKRQLTRKNQSRTPRRNRNAEATADCPTLKCTQP